MRPIVGMITIGQSPRSDVVPDMVEILGPGVEIRERGALDGLSPREIAALAPAPDDDLLVTRLVACDEPAHRQLGLDRVDGADDPRIVGGQEPDQRHEERVPHQRDPEPDAPGQGQQHQAHQDGERGVQRRHRSDRVRVVRALLVERVEVPDRDVAPDHADRPRRRLVDRV